MSSAPWVRWFSFALGSLHGLTVAWATAGLSTSFALALLLPQIAHAGATGQVTQLSGMVVIRKPNGGSRILSAKSDVLEGDVIATTENSFARVKFADGSEAVLRPGSQVKVVAFRFEEQSPQQNNAVLALLKGGVRIVTGEPTRKNPDSFRVSTPSAIIGIRGTNFALQFCNDDCAALATPRQGIPANGLHADVASGAITLTTQAGSLTVGVGQAAFVQGPAILPVLVPPSQIVRVALPSPATRPAAQGLTIGKGGPQACKG